MHDDAVTFRLSSQRPPSVCPTTYAEHRACSASTICNYGSGRKRLCHFMRYKATEHSVIMRLSSALLYTFLHGAGLGNRKDFSNNDNQPFEVQWLIYVRWNLTFNSSTFCPHSAFMCFVWISEQTAIISLYNINWLVCITERKCVYCAVRTGCLG